jgi:hypothetical protein
MKDAQIDDLSKTLDGWARELQRLATVRSKVLANPTDYSPFTASEVRDHIKWTLGMSHETESMLEAYAEMLEMLADQKEAA